jgi:urease accessory protein
LARGGIALRHAIDRATLAASGLHREGWRMKTISRFVAVLLLSLCHTAWAHHFMDGQLPRTFAQGLLSGLGHPLIGADHAAFVVGAGFLLGSMPQGLRGVVALVVGSLVGAALHLAGIGLPLGEALVALSVILTGGLVLAARRMPISWLAGGLALAGLLHGHAYAESIFGAEPAPLFAYLVGFTLTQLCVATAALYAHRHVMATAGARARTVGSALGAAVGVIGLVFLAGNLAA